MTPEAKRAEAFLFKQRIYLDENERRLAKLVVASGQGIVRDDDVYSMRQAVRLARQDVIIAEADLEIAERDFPEPSPETAGQRGK